MKKKKEKYLRLCAARMILGDAYMDVRDFQGGQFFQWNER